MSSLSLAAAPAIALPGLLRRRAARLLGRLFRGDGYRPEQHYMRGGRTEGSRAMARARMIAGD